MKEKIFWLCRDNDRENEFSLKIYADQPNREKDYCEGTWLKGHAVYASPSIIKSVTGLSLRKGQGPVKVKIAAEVIK